MTTSIVEVFDLMIEQVCEGCKGAPWVMDSGCYEDCAAFQIRQLCEQLDLEWDWSFMRAWSWQEDAVLAELRDLARQKGDIL